MNPSVISPNISSLIVPNLVNVLQLWLKTIPGESRKVAPQIDLALKTRNS